MKLLLTTRADSGVQDWINLTHPIFEKYAKRVGADFIVLNHKSDCDHGDGKWHYRIMKHYDLHDEYDRILHFDTDIILKPDCPNLFEIVPYDSIGTILEDKGSRRGARHHTIREIQNKFGNVGWTEDYINTGTFLTSKCHRDIYQKINNEYWIGWGFDDAHLGYNINKLGYKVKELHYKYNHLTMFSEPWNNHANRFDSHVIHYAGVGIYDHGVRNKLEQAMLDHYKIYNIEGK
jgi:lipopolysaccharide biosynthesis glycosyltransferase